MVLNEKVESGDSSLSGDQKGAQADSGPRSELKPELTEPELNQVSDSVARLPVDLPGLVVQVAVVGDRFDRHLCPSINYFFSLL